MAEIVNNPFTPNFGAVPELLVGRAHFYIVNQSLFVEKLFL